ncbi:MAG: hypothetical protein AB7O38_31735 [Pirellulaceae bacterium]
MARRFGAAVEFDENTLYGRIEERSGAIYLNAETATFDVLAHEVSHMRFARAMGKWGTGNSLTSFELNLMEAIGYWGTYRKALATSMSSDVARLHASIGPAFAQSAIQAMRYGWPQVRQSLDRAVSVFGRPYIESSLRFDGLGMSRRKRFCFWP